MGIREEWICVRDGGAGGTASEDLWYSYDDEIQRNMIVNIFTVEI
jgi:hypothetical protein